MYNITASRYYWKNTYQNISGRSWLDHDNMLYNLDRFCVIRITIILTINIKETQSIFKHFRDMCSAEDTEVENSALKLREDDQQQITKKSNCCNK